jgi:hypothetical protein
MNRASRQMASLLRISMSVIKNAVLLLLLVVASMMVQSERPRAMNSVVDAQGGANQMPDQKCRRESAGNNDSERAARYDQCMARKKK